MPIPFHFLSLQVKIHQLHRQTNFFDLFPTILAKMPPEKAVEMSAFERRRLENMAANKAILDDISKTAVKMTKKPAPAPKPRSKKPAEPRAVRPKREVAPTRASSRLAGRDAETPVKREYGLVEIGVADRPVKKSRVADDLNLGDIKVEGRKFAHGADSLLAMIPRRGADPGVRTFDEDDVKETTDGDLKALRKRMGNLELYDKWAVNGKSTPRVDGGRTAADLLFAQRHKDCSPAHLCHGLPPDR